MNKKMKSAHCSIEKKDHDEMAGSARSKFEWLNSFAIRDANKRRPNDPLYDKSTLFIPPDALRKMSTSQKQYWNIKCKYMDVVLFFKVGKFYELYELDAEIGQKELDWKMTVSGVGKCRQVGISESGIDDAVDKLIARGYKVGRIEQMESANQAKARGVHSVIERKLVHVSTPSTAVDNIGTDAVHLLALKEVTLASSGFQVFGFAFLDYAALKIWVGSVQDDDSSAALGALLMQVSPRELIYETSGISKETQRTIRKYASAGSVKMQLTPLSGIDFSDAAQIRNLIHSKGFFNASTESWLSALDCTMNQDVVICALGGLIGHLTRLMLHDALKNGEVLPYHVYKTCLRMDGQTLVNLEIFSNNFNGGSSGTLYKHLNHCVTASGKRMLRRWICHPLKDIDAINKRLDVVEGFIQNCGLGPTTLGYLQKIPDLERLLGQVRSTVGLSSLLQLPFIGEKIIKKRIKTFIMLINGLRNGIDLLNDLQRADHGILALYKIVDIPSLSYLPELIHKFEERMQNEFPCGQVSDVNANGANDLAALMDVFIGKASEWSLVINAVSTIDVLRSFAAMTLSSFGAMCRPQVLLKDDVPVLRMKGLWHPYAFAGNANSLVPNDLTLGQDLSGLNRFALLLTGPNMGGKSTIMRATCLAVVLAQVCIIFAYACLFMIFFKCITDVSFSLQLGCYVPCTSCELTLADSIFTRLGATDRIMTGESTFLVECTETASVLQKATVDSLVLLDELGRGTSTFDGYAIAYAVFRHLVERVRCRQLFATHYHSLTKEFASHPHVSLQVMRAKIAGNFKSSEQRAEFSTLHEEWLRAALAVSAMDGQPDDDDVMDTLFCIQQELKSHFRKAR
uniref:DNA mismatch repair proteins mutS family domain-containing protein n=1 Tax=Zea mays TaxID=4577 RepID=A0A804MYX5_MAIZE